MPVQPYHLEEELDVLRVEKNDASEIQLPDSTIKLQCNQTRPRTIGGGCIMVNHSVFAAAKYHSNLLDSLGRGRESRLCYSLANSWQIQLITIDQIWLA